MATSPLSAAGVGSGLDVHSIVQQLVAIESRPIQQLKTAETKLQSSISTFGQLKSLMSGLQTAAQKLTDSGLWSGNTATSSNESALTVNSTQGSAAAGQYVVEVSSLARSQNLASSHFADGSSATVGGGKLNIELGTWDGGSFSAKGDSVEIDIAAGSTLAQVRDQINAAGAGVTAAIVTDADGARLTLSSSDSGLSNQMRISASNLEAGSQLAALTYDGSSGGGLTQTQAASNAQATINGLVVSSESNTFEGVLDGISLQVKSTTTSAATVTVGPNTESATKAIEEFVAAYNKLNSFLTEQTAYNPDSKKAGSLQGDSAAIGLRNSMRSLLMGQGGGSDVFSGLQSIGISAAKDGTLSIDQTKLKEAMGNLPEMAKLFNHADGGIGAAGFGQKFNQFTSSALGFEGVISSRTERLNATIKSNQDAQARMGLRMEKYEARLLAQYTALDVNMGQMNSMANYVAQQMGVLLSATAR